MWYPGPEADAGRHALPAPGQPWDPQELTLRRLGTRCGSLSISFLRPAGCPSLMSSSSVRGPPSVLSGPPRSFLLNSSAGGESWLQSQGPGRGLAVGPAPGVAYVGTGLSCCHHSGPPPRPLTRAPRRLSAARDRRRLACPVRAVGGAAGRRAQTPFLASDIPHLGDKAARCYPPDRTQQPGPCCS